MVFLTPLPMVYRTPYPWNFDPSAYLLIRNEGSKYHGVQCSIQGGQYTMDENWPPESIYHGGQNTIWHRSFLHSSPITGFVTRLTRVPLVEQEQPTFPEHPSSPRFKWGLCYSIFSFMCMFCRSLFVLLSFFAIVLSVLWFTDSYYPFGILKLFLRKSFYSFPNRLLC